MKKYIIIAGVPRAGKSTVSQIEKFEVYYFLSSDVTPDERFQILKSYDTPNDYTYYHSEEENKRDCIDIVNISHLMKEQCILYRLPYYETSHHRECVLDEFLSYLDKK